MTALLRARTAFVFMALFSVAGLTEGVPQEQAAVTIFAAASLTDSVGAIARSYETEHHQPLKLSFASSSVLARQIENGAPADLFLSADEEWMQYLDARKLVAPGTWIRPIGNQLVLVAPADHTSSIRLTKGFDLAGALGDGRLAVGDPAHVPAGRYAQQALEYLGVWAVAEPRLARAENVRSALLLVERGEAPLGIVYATDARVSKQVSVVAIFPDESHTPVRYSFAAVAGHDTPAARAILKALSDPHALEVFASYGFAAQ